MKFKNIDKAYLAKRKKLAVKHDKPWLWEHIDHWPLYVGTANLGRYMAISEIVKETLSVPGHIAEFGSWKGANLMFMTKLLNLWDPHGNKVVHCFDSFEGLATFTDQDGGSESHTGEYRGQLDELKEFIDLYELQDCIDIHVGLIQDSLPELLQKEPQLSFSLIYCDTDLYEPTNLILSELHQRLMPGGCFVFDQWNDSRWPGEGLAGNEFIREYTDFYEPLHVQAARQPNLVLRKL